MKTLVTASFLATSLTACTVEQDQNSNNFTDSGSSNLHGISSIEEFALQALSGVGGLMYAYDEDSLQFPGLGCNSTFQDYMGDVLIGEVSLQLQCVLDNETWGLDYDIGYDANIVVDWSVDESGDGNYSLAGTYTFNEFSESGATINSLSFSNLDMVRFVAEEIATDEFYFNLSQITQQFGASNQTYQSINPFIYNLDQDRYTSGEMTVTSENGVVRSYQLNADYVLEQH